MIETPSLERHPSINAELLQQLEPYLEKRETKLIEELTRALAPVILLPEIKCQTFKDWIEIVDGKIDETLLNHRLPSFASVQWNKVIERLNHSLWDYLEILEGTITELFFQMEAGGIYRWNDELAHHLKQVFDFLSHKIYQAQSGIATLNHDARKLRAATFSQTGLLLFLRKCINLESSLDGTLQPHLTNTLHYMTTEYTQFLCNFHSYQELQGEVAPKVKKFNDYEVFSSFDFTFQEDFREIYRFLRMWEMNIESRTVLSEFLQRAIKEKVNPESAYRLFSQYFEGLQKALFQLSRSLKTSPAGRDIDVIAMSARDRVLFLRAELHHLKSTVELYREFLLKTDADPYVRSRLGFTEWVVGPEPEVTKRFLQLIFDMEAFDLLFEQLIASLSNKEAVVVEIRGTPLYHEIEHVLHEMSQPLTSEARMVKCAVQLSEALSACNELGSFYPSTVDYVEEVIQRALKSDWKYHVLDKNQSFQKLQVVHKAIR